ncbi:MAG: hypothetical protein M3540_12860 [Actinomycetota bacterium]|nr:hypothetical protein [Actinomycetota bacterium]
MPPDFFNSREDALLLCVVAIIGYAIYKDPRGILGSFASLLRALAHIKLLLLFATAAAYAAGLAYVGHRFGIWHRTALKETIYWFLGTGVVLVGDATQANPRDPKSFRKLLRRAIRLTLLMEFLINLYVFPLLVEIVLIPLILMFYAMQLVAPKDDPQYTLTRALIDGVLAAAGFVLIAYVAIRMLTNFDGFATRENAEDFLIAPVFTLALLPLLYVIAGVSRREQENLRKRWRQGEH